MNEHGSRHNKFRHRLYGFAWFLGVLGILTAMFTFSFLLTSYIYRVAGLHMSLLLVQIINSLMGLLFTGLFVSAASRIAQARGWVPERRGFGPIITALEKIAQGDFSIRLDNEFEDNRMIGELANTINKMALELNQMENMRQEFISNVSHEIQSPLTSIRGFAQALENDELSIEERHHYLSIIENESTRLSRITEDLLKLASLEADHLRFEPKPYRLDKQIRSLILTCEPQWTEKQIEIEADLHVVTINADEDLLCQVWLNLIHNSIKFTPEKGMIKVTLQPHNGRNEFQISDTGMGISVQDQLHIFERFYKTDKSRTRSKEGSGLGLSIVKKILDLHQGTIHVESEVGKGTTFTISLP
jgi:two-component system, OmpR family, phosphate regulon sensor histidine kinase PhoR